MHLKVNSVRTPTMQLATVIGIAVLLVGGVAVPLVGAVTGPQFRHEAPTTVSAPAEVSTSPAVSAGDTPSDHAAVSPGRLVERPCDVAAVYVADCYWLEVPERRDIIGARTIRLWVAVIHQDGPDVAPITRIHLPGGPGFPASPVGSPALSTSTLETAARWS